MLPTQFSIVFINKTSPIIFFCFRYFLLHQFNLSRRKAGRFVVTLQNSLLNWIYDLYNTFILYPLKIQAHPRNDYIIQTLRFVTKLNVFLRKCGISYVSIEPIYFIFTVFCYVFSSNKIGFETDKCTDRNVYKRKKCLDRKWQ